MKNTIMYYYDLDVSNIHQIDKTYYFYLDEVKYYFIPFDRPIDEGKAIYELNLEMLKRDLLVHEIIMNKNKELVSFYNETPYILLRINVSDKANLQLSDLNMLAKSSYMMPYHQILDKSNWVGLWSNKLDYFEYQITQMGKNYPLIRESFSYFLGMAENAISYINDTIKALKPNDLDGLVLSHKRISANLKLYDFYHPLNIIVDHKARDLSEYIKSSFFAGKFSFESLEEYFRYNYFSPYGYQLLYGRLLFPTFYFDVYENIMNTSENEKKLIKIIDKTNDYEDFLYDMYFFIKKRSPIKEVSWLIKK